MIAGKTFSYTADGPIGLAGGKHVIVASSRGGLYAPGMPFEANDFQEKYLRAVFAFLGIGDIEIIRAEGLALSPAHRETALNRSCDHSRYCRSGKSSSCGMTDTWSIPAWR